MKIYNLTGKKGVIKKEIIGGKCLPIFEMNKKGIDVPTSFAIGYDFFENHLENIGFWLKFNSSDFVNNNNLEKNLSNARNLIINTDIDPKLISQLKQILSKLKFWAVRSSANIEDSTDKSWAGGFESYIGVKDKDVSKYIKHVWASVFTQRVLNYIDNPKKIKDIKMSVLLQEAINSDTSGVCFTQESLEEDEEMIIESIHGIGEYLVQGEVIPDRYIIDRKTNIISEVIFNEQGKLLSFNNQGVLKKILNKNKKEQKLTGAEIIELSKICFNIEKIYKNPRDIEWCKKGKKFYILQSRPITT